MKVKDNFVYTKGQNQNKVTASSKWTILAKSSDDSLHLMNFEAARRSITSYLEA